MAEKAMSTVLMVRIRMTRSKAASSEGAAGGVSLRTSPRTSCFSYCPRGRLGDAEGEDRHQQGRDRQDVEGPAPAVGASHLGRDEAHQQRTGGQRQALTHAHGRVEPAAHVDRIGVGQQRTVDAVRARLRDAGTEAGQEEDQDVGGKPRGGHHQTEREGGPTDDGRAPVTVGQPPHGNNAQDEEAARDPCHEGDGAGRDVERRLDVRGKNGEPGALQIVQRDDDRQNDEGARPGRAQPLAQRDLLLARSREHVLGEQELRHGLCRQLSLGGRIDHQVSQVRCAHVIGGAGTRMDLRPSARSSDSRSPASAPPPSISAHGATARGGGADQGHDA